MIDRHSFEEIFKAYQEARSYTWNTTTNTTANKYINSLNTVTSTTLDCSGYIQPSPTVQWTMFTEAFNKRKEITEEEIIDLIKGDK